MPTKALDLRVKSPSGLKVDEKGKSLPANLKTPVSQGEGMMMDMIMGLRSKLDKTLSGIRRKKSVAKLD